MAVLDSPITTYSDTTPQKRVITDVISMIDPKDTPMLDALGGLDGASGKFRFVNGPSTKVEWLEDTLYSLTDSLGASIASDTTAVTVADASAFKEGDIVLVDAELMWISAVNTGTDVVTVTRHFGGTQATHANSAAVEIIGEARLEGDDSDDRAFTDRTSNSNYTQIFHEEVKVTRSQNQIAQYGIAEEFEYQATKVIPSLMRLIEKNLFYGVRGAGSATTPRSAGGLSTFITNNTVNAGGAVVQADFEDAAEASWSDGGVGPWTAPVSAANYQVIKNFYDSSNFLRVDRTETTAGMVLGTIVTPFGDVNLTLDRWSPSAKIYLVDPKHAGMLTYYPFTRAPLAVSGDYQKEEVVGEFTFCLRQDKAHAVITGIS